ncbi:MAG: methyltransferase domain-containing protein [Methanomicrobiales archaeon]
MQLLATPYQYNLLSDYERLSAFYDAIKDNCKGIVFDIGTGSGILSIFASPYAQQVYAVELDSGAAQCAGENLKKYDNVQFIEGDAKNIEFPEKADLIICEMLDTALIDEEQIPIIKTVSKYLKKKGKIIPYKILTGLEPVHMKAEHLCYENEKFPQHKILGPLIIYNETSFYQEINENVKVDLIVKISREGELSGIKLTSFTILTPDIVCGPSPMMNPPLFIPTDKMFVEKDDKIRINLEYQMGGGLDSIKIRTAKIPEKL